MKRHTLHVALFLLIYSCSTDADFPKKLRITEEKAAPALEYGLLHNTIMDHILIESDNNMTDRSYEESILKSVEEYFTANDRNKIFSSNNKKEDFLMLAKNDIIHVIFSENYSSIKSYFEILNKSRTLSNRDIKHIDDLMELINTYNNHLVSQKQNSQNPDEFLKSLNDIYLNYEKDKMDSSPITIALLEIAKSSSEYWSENILLDIPVPIQVTYEEEFIIPALLLRVIIKDVIGAITGALEAGIVHRLKTNDWNWDTGKVSEEDVAWDMLIGAVGASGGFLGRSALKALKYL